MAKLVTGGYGYIGAELTHILVDRGDEVIVFDNNRSRYLSDIEHKVQVVLGDLGNWSEVFNSIQDRHITSIYHLGSMLTSKSEINPWASFRTNIIGTYNVLEAARLLKVEKLMFTSSIGTFDPTVESELTDTTLQRPPTMYGIGKLYCEGLGKFYRKKFNLDFRSIRYPSVVGPGNITHWDAPMIQSAALGIPFRCPVSEDFAEAMIYYKDAARAALMVLEAPRENVKMVNYNVGGIPVVSAGELKKTIKKFIPDAKISYATPNSSQPHSNIRIWDDSYAREEWNWQPKFSTLDDMVSAFIQELKANPERYRASS